MVNSLVTRIEEQADEVIARWHGQLDHAGLSPADPLSFAGAARTALIGVAGRAEELRGRTSSDDVLARTIPDLQAYAATRPTPGVASLIREWHALRAILWQALAPGWTALPVASAVEEQAALNFALDEALAQLAEPPRAAERAAFNQHLAVEIERAARYGRRCSLAILDIHRLRLVNEKSGREAGDRLLAELAAMLRREIRQADRAFRYGGDEFVVILPEADFGAGEAVMRRLSERAAELYRQLNLPLGLTLQCGVASFPEDAQAAKTLFLLADNRLRESKRQQEPSRTANRRSAKAAVLGLLRIKPSN